MSFTVKDKRRTEGFLEVLELGGTHDRSRDLVLGETPGHSDLRHRDALLLRQLLDPVYTQRSINTSSREEYKRILTSSASLRSQGPCTG